jgi:Mlc titration factor MtfA (ptsG expression regulator)
MPVIVISYLLSLAFILLGFFVIGGASPIWRAVLIVLGVSIAAAVYVLERAIREWWNTIKPSVLDNDSRKILEKIYPYYAQLNPDQKLKFEQRLFDLKLQKEFQLSGDDTVPGDIVLLSSAMATQVTFGLDTYRYPKLGVIVFYPRPFRSPFIPRKPHTIELNEEDFNCIILAIDNLVDGHTKPKQYYNGGLHIFAKALQIELGIKDEDIPFLQYAENKDIFFHKLTVLRNLVDNYLEIYTGHKNVELFPVCVEHFFQIPAQLSATFPEVYKYIQTTLNQDPLYQDSPLVQIPQVVAELPAPESNQTD